MVGNVSIGHGRVWLGLTHPRHAQLDNISKQSRHVCAGQINAVCFVAMTALACPNFENMILPCFTTRCAFRFVGNLLNILCGICFQRR